jgi:hypothetical protein
MYYLSAVEVARCYARIEAIYAARTQIMQRTGSVYQPQAAMPRLAA